MGEIHIFCPIPLKGNKSKCRRLGNKHKNGILEGEKVSIESKAGVEKTCQLQECGLEKVKEIYYNLTAEQLGTMQVLCKQHNLAVERSIEREREERRKPFAKAYKAETWKARLKPRSTKEELIYLFMRTHSATEFWFYPDVDEAQLWLLASEHFPEEGETGVVDCSFLITDDGVRSSLKTADGLNMWKMQLHRFR